MFSWRSGVMHMPFQMQSMFLELSSISLESQLISMNSGVQAQLFRHGGCRQLCVKANQGVRPHRSS